MMLQRIRQMVAEALAYGVPEEEIEYVYEETEQRIETCQLILPPGVRSSEELRELAEKEQSRAPLVWTPENSHLFES